MKCFVLFGAALLSVACAQKQYTTPVPILKQINKHNEDGSYSYGYEGADGTFKIETKYADGQVYGKYGYVDDTGKVREIEYGASKRGFEPAGNDINVPPPTLRASNEYVAPLAAGEEDDGQYREDPTAYYKEDKYNQQQPAYQQPAYQQPAYKQPVVKQPAYTRPVYQQPQQPAYQEPAYQPQTYQQSNYQQPSYREPAPRPQPAFRPQAQSDIDFDDFRSRLGFTQVKQAAAPAPRPAPPAPRPQPAYNNYNTGYNNDYSNNGYNTNYNSGYSNNNYNRGYTNPTPSYQNSQPLPYNVDLNSGSYSLNY